ncbi:hypothetical protein M409DRAFT_69297 [Zasmidium cellare ATCC 36951]|uniref:Mak10 subunit, NatC N(Alpha)-terminal acetyltransferase n=1 Tax=Zasmidium cellare ATCC 36951 TaxID=1080233 RepID=A0A6A6C852_ZASCE|nr:uncharacterized protein M409DRAFT_69297 [Zasmidium cellare ATCC 36951]KAF2162062.1 hypothetical protein M409DRAFT_69297 [Zasmidium cellare ATCC 36951]
MPSDDVADGRLLSLVTGTASKNRGVRDVTEDFVVASEQLQPGELVKDECFTLFEAVGALEIMDPKMDSGRIPPGDSFEPDFDVCAGLNANQVLWIMDELFRLEMSFQDGYPLSQNIFTSLHVFRLLAPENRHPYHLRFEGLSAKDETTVQQQLVHFVLRAYCIAVVKCVQCTLNLIQTYTYYEEEDFVTYLFGRELLPTLSPVDGTRLLIDAADWLETSGLDQDVQDTLRLRLLAREELLTSMDSTDEGVDEWDKFKAKIQDIRQQHELATPVPDAFSDKVQRQLATSTPPRPMAQLSWDQACEKWTQLCDDILTTRALTSFRIRQSPHCLQRATWAFAYRQPPPGTYARAKMQEILTAGDCVAGEVSHFDLMLTDIRDLVLAGDPLADPASFQIEVPTDPRHRASRLIEDFMSRMFGEYTNIYRMVCQNRCRMRRTFTQALPIFDELETVAHEVDEQLNEIVVPRLMQDVSGNLHKHCPLSTWTRIHKLQMMIWVIQLGFETDLYLPDELREIFTVLQHLTRTSLSCLIEMELFVVKKLQLPEAGKLSREDREQCRSSSEWIKSLSLQDQVNVTLASLLSSFCTTLQDLALIDARPKPYSQAQHRYEARYKPFLGLQWDSVPGLEDLERQGRADLIINLSEIQQICSSYGEAIKTTRGMLNELKGTNPTQAKYVGTEDEWKKNIKSLETTCVAISVAASQLQRICEKHPGKLDRLGEVAEVSFPPPEKRYHIWWVVPQLKEK